MLNINLKEVNKANYYYLLVNIGLSAFSFIRSFVFMKALDLTALGMISLMQTIFMLIGLLQCGLLNGGYRIISFGKAEEIEKTNNTIFSYVAILIPIGLLFCVFSQKFGWVKDLSAFMLILSVFFGLFTLINNWFHNVLIGEQKLSDLNKVNIISYTASFLTLPLAFFFGFWGAVIVITVQPLCFVGLCLFTHPELRPTRLFFKKQYIRYILSFGFIPFLGGIFTALYTQIERWSITGQLGVEALGAYYLVGLYVGLYQLVPTSLDAIFFPKAVKSYEMMVFNQFKKYIKYYSLLLFGYGIFITIITMLFLKPAVAFVFPKHLIGVPFVYIVLPGLILKSMIQPISLVLNSAVILKPMLYINLANLVLSASIIITLITTHNFSLSHVAFVTLVSGAFSFVSYVFTLFVIRKKLYIKK